MTSVRGAAWPLAAVALAAAVGAADRGGFTPSSRTLFAGLAALALAVGIARDERPTLGFLGSPPCLCMLGLALLSAISVVWTVGDHAAALRWSLVLAGFAALTAVAAVAARESVVAAIATVIALLAGAEALAGLVAAGLRIEPMAERIEGSWRPGGSFEYPPALALLQLSALPLLLTGMAARRRSLAALAAVGAALAGAVVALAAGRLEIVLGLAVLALWIAWPAARMGVSRRWAVAAAAVPLVAGVAARIVAGGYAYPGATNGDAGRLLGLAAVMAAVVAIWTLARSLQPFGAYRDLNAAANDETAGLPRPGVAAPTAGSGKGEGSRRRLLRSLLAGATALAAALVVALLAGTSGKWVEPSSGIAHGRVAEWRAAAETALDHPLTGAGADAYAVASVGHQPQPAGLYAHDLPLETWAELGPLGLALVCGLYVSVGALCWRIRRRPGAWLVVPGALAFLIANLVDWPWHLAGAGAVWALCVGGCLALAATQDD